MESFAPNELERAIVAFLLPETEEKRNSTMWSVYKAVCERLGKQPIPDQFETEMRRLERLGLVAKLSHDSFRATRLAKHYAVGAEMSGHPLSASK